MFVCVSDWNVGFDIVRRAKEIVFSKNIRQGDNNNSNNGKHCFPSHFGLFITRPIVYVTRRFRLSCALIVGCDQHNQLDRRSIYISQFTQTCGGICLNRRGWHRNFRMCRYNRRGSYSICSHFMWVYTHNFQFSNMSNKELSLYHTHTHTLC